MTFADLAPTLQIAVGPVILISGVGLLLLSMTNRFARLIDRSRQIARELKAGPTPEEHERLLAQLAILERRSRNARLAIALATGSILLAAILVIALFLAALSGLPLVVLIAALFTGCLALLILALLLFLRDINLSLAALKLELSGVRPTRT